MFNLCNAERLVNLLTERNLRFSCAESCTGGMLASSVVDVPDASKVFDVSFVTYAPWAKTEFVNVRKDTIESYSVVSEEVALEMARGALQKSGAQVAVGITGIAGPSGGTETQPVGTVCFAFVVCTKEFTVTKNFSNIGRSAVRALATDFAVNTLIEILEKE